MISARKQTATSNPGSFSDPPCVRYDLHCLALEECDDVTSVRATVHNWRSRSIEMRAIAETMKHQETRSTMERLADSYDQMAESMERRLIEMHTQRPSVP
jgi:hypothetical protein